MASENTDLFYIKLFTGFIAGALIVYILKELSHIFIPFSMALLMYFLFNGGVKRLVELKIPRFFVLIFVLFFIFVLFYFFGLLIYTGTTSFVNEFPSYSEKITETLRNLLLKLKIPIGDVTDYINNIDWKHSLNPGEITSILSSTLGSFTTFLGNLVLVLLFLMFMLAGRGAFTIRMGKSLTSEKVSKIAYIVNSIEDQAQHYLLIKTFISLITAIIGGIILAIGGIDFVIFSALLIFFLNFIPNFGSIVATIFPILIGFIEYGLSSRVILVACALIATQFIIGNILEPKITGKSLNLSPIIILISLIFWGWVWGIVGMILAVPLTSSLKIIFEHIQSLKPIAAIMSAE